MHAEADSSSKLVYFMFYAIVGKAFAENSSLTSCLFSQKKDSGLHMELYSIIKYVFDTQAFLYEE